MAELEGQASRPNQARCPPSNQDSRMHAAGDSSGWRAGVDSVTPVRLEFRTSAQAIRHRKGAASMSVVFPHGCGSEALIFLRPVRKRKVRSMCPENPTRCRVRSCVPPNRSWRIAWADAIMTGSARNLPGGSRNWMPNYDAAHRSAAGEALPILKQAAAGKTLPIGRRPSTPIQCDA